MVSLLVGIILVCSPRPIKKSESTDIWFGRVKDEIMNLSYILLKIAGLEGLEDVFCIDKFL